MSWLEDIFFNNFENNPNEKKLLSLIMSSGEVIQFCRIFHKGITDG